MAEKLKIRPTDFCDLTSFSLVEFAGFRRKTTGFILGHKVRVVEVINGEQFQNCSSPNLISFNAQCHFEVQSHISENWDYQETEDEHPFSDM